jgi:hypothetical protein
MVEFCFVGHERSDSELKVICYLSKEVSLFTLLSYIYMSMQVMYASDVGLYCGYCS